MRQKLLQALSQSRSLVSAVGERKHAEQCRHNENASIAILNVGRMNDGVEKTQCVDKNARFLPLISAQRHGAVCDSHGQPVTDHALNVKFAGDFLAVGNTELLNLISLPRAALALAAFPSQEKAEQLPQRIQAQTTWHDRVVVEMARKQLAVGHDILAFSEQSTVVSDCRDSIEHEHRR
jgi:hypothetical protein